MRSFAALRSPLALCLAAPVYGGLLILAACTEPTSLRPTSAGILESRNNPAPVLTSVSPDSVRTYATGVTLTLRGSGFVSSSTVLLDSVARATSYISHKELRVALADSEFVRSHAFQVRVSNPSPGGGVSSALPLTVWAPPPVLTTVEILEHAGCVTVGSPSGTMRVTGSGFVKNSEVRFDGEPRPTSVVDSTTMWVMIPDSDLDSVGVFPVTVVTPGPGGGTSDAVPLRVCAPAPELLHLQSRGAHVGPGFSLFLHGRGFRAGARVVWDGAVLATEYLSSTRLRAQVPDSLLTTPGERQITVRNGAEYIPSDSLPITVRPLPANYVSDYRTVALQARDIAVDPVRGRLYLSIRSDASWMANYLVAVNPSTGTVTDTLAIGPDPSRLAISDDAQFLYVGVNGTGTVRRVNLASFSVDLEWALPTDEDAGEIRVLPGQPRSVAVSRHRLGWSPPLRGVTVYDDGVARSNSSPGHTGGNRIEFLSSPDSLFGFNNAHSGHEFFTMRVDGSGVYHVRETQGLISGGYTQITGAAGRIYGTDGSIVDAERHVRVGSLGVSASSLAADATLGRAVLLVRGGLAVHDINTFQRLHSIPLSYTLDHPALANPHLVRWGEDGIAFLDTSKLYILRSPLFGP